MNKIIQHYCTCCTHKHAALCTKLHNITAHAVHTNTQLHAKNYITLLHILYTKTHRFMQKLYNFTVHALHINKKLYVHNYITLLHMLYAKTHSFMRIIT